MTPNQTAVLEAQLANLDRKLDAIHKSLSDDIEEVKGLQRQTNGRVRQAESDIVAIKAREEEREKQRDQSLLRQVAPGVITAVTVLLITWALIGLPTPH